MNSDFKGHIEAYMDKIFAGTESRYHDDFYKGLTMVTNALDNVQARRYLDQRTVKNRIPMIDSGTLGPKGHVQVVIPNNTESYSSTNDAEDTNEIPVCTLKMFPEETLHCVEWARDKFEKLFNKNPQNYNKVLLEEPHTIKVKDNFVLLKDALKLFTNKPTSFDQCQQWARNKFNKYFVTDVE